MRFLQRLMPSPSPLTTLRPHTLGWLAAALLATGCQTQPRSQDDVPAPPMITTLADSNPATTAAPAATAPAPLLEAVALASGEHPEQALDWAGTYQAILPCNGCRGVAISVQLRADHTAVVRERRIGEPHDGTITPSFRGSFHFSRSHPGLIALTEAGISLPAYHFWVSEGWIELRDRRTGQRLGASDAYRLPKTSTSH